VEAASIKKKVRKGFSNHMNNISFNLKGILFTLPKRGHTNLNFLAV
jgi:hypothetical protein